jgi:hypothetical protein
MPSESLKGRAPVLDAAVRPEGEREGRGRSLDDPARAWELDSPDWLWQPTPVPVNWLHNRLTVTGLAEEIMGFRAAAAVRAWSHGCWTSSRWRRISSCP